MWFEVCRLDAARCCRDVLQTVKVCRKMPPRATSCHHESINKSNSDIWEIIGARSENVKQSNNVRDSFPFTPVSRMPKPNNITQHPDHPIPDEFVAVRSDATLCVALCKPRRPSVQLLQRESIRARWLEMAREQRSLWLYCASLSYRSLSLSLSLQRSCGLKEMKSKYSLNMFESS